MGIFDRVLKSGEGKKVRALASLVPDVHALEPELERLTDDQLAAKPPEFRQRLDRGQDLDPLLIQPFAGTREAPHRTSCQRHFDVQLMGRAALHSPRAA